MKSKEVDVLFVLTDISGYTQYMLDNEQSSKHAEDIIAVLMRTLIDQLKVPLKIAEIEGDAIFLFAVKEDPRQWKRDCERISKKLENFSQTFYDRVSEIMDTSVSDCGTCLGVGELGIKLVVHSGRAVINRIDRFLRISGVDTIIAHRLLKNSVQWREYILVSKKAFDDMSFSNPHHFAPHQERYADIGTVDLMLYPIS